MSSIPDHPHTQWVKSSYSNPDGSGCIEWAPKTATASGTVPVRDSKRPDIPALAFSGSAWLAFLVGVKADTFTA